MKTMLPRQSPRAANRTFLLIAVLTACLLPAAAALAAAPEPVPVVGSSEYGAGIPRGPSPDNKNNLYTLQVFYFDNVGGLAKDNLTVNNIPQTAGLPFPTAAQLSAASAAKAAAIVAAINAANFNAVTAAVQAKTRPALAPNGVMYDQTWYTVNGIRQSIQNYKFPNPNGPKTYLSSPVYKIKDPTQEGGDGTFNFKKGGGGGSPGSMYKGSYNGSGGTSSGLDINNTQSMVGFGIVDYSNPDSPISYLAKMSLSPNMNDDQILGGLATIFNTTLSSSGFTATFDSTLDSLFFDQLLPPTMAIWEDNSDTGLFYTASLDEVPEPASLALLAAGGLTLLLKRRSV